MHQITGNHGSSSYQHLKRMLRKGFDYRFSTGTGDSNDNFFLMDKNRLEKENYELFWMYGEKDRYYKLGDRYAFLTDKAKPMFSFSPVDSFGHYSEDDRVAVSEVSPDDISTVVIELNDDSKIPLRKRFYDMQLKKLKPDINIVYHTQKNT